MFVCLPSQVRKIGTLAGESFDFVQISTDPEDVCVRATDGRVYGSAYLPRSEGSDPDTTVTCRNISAKQWAGRFPKKGEATITADQNSAEMRCGDVTVPLVKVAGRIPPLVPRSAPTVSVQVNADWLIKLLQAAAAVDAAVTLEVYSDRVGVGSQAPNLKFLGYLAMNVR